MTAKKIVMFFFCVVLILGIVFCFFIEKQVGSKKVEVTSENKPTEVHIASPKALEKRYDLYSETPYDLPLMSIYEISKLPLEIKKVIDEVLEISQGFYVLKIFDDKVLILLQNPVMVNNTYPRHDLQYIEILKNGNKVFHNAGYTGEDGETFVSLESKNGEWYFEKSIEPLRPVKHVMRDEKGKIKFTEYWNYEENEPWKYQMKDEKGKIVSILKEIQETDSNYRREHIFYDNDGNISMSVTINYDGANISRFTYYNSHQSLESISIISEYLDGLKVKEQIYNQDYKLVNTFVSSYENNERTSIELFDSNGEFQTKISS